MCSNPGADADADARWTILRNKWLVKDPMVLQILATLRCRCTDATRYANLVAWLEDDDDDNRARCIFRNGKTARAVYALAIEPTPTSDSPWSTFLDSLDERERTFPEDFDADADADMDIVASQRAAAFLVYHGDGDGDGDGGATCWPGFALYCVRNNILIADMLAHLHSHLTDQFGLSKGGGLVMRGRHENAEILEILSMYSE